MRIARTATVRMVLPAPILQQEEVPRSRLYGSLGQISNSAEQAFLHGKLCSDKTDESPSMRTDSAISIKYLP